MMRLTGLIRGAGRLEVASVRVVKGLVAAIAAAMLVAGCGGGADRAAPSSSSSTTTATVSPNEAIVAWGKGELSPSLHALGNDLKWIGAAVQGFDFADARAGCRQLDTDVDTLDGRLPAPDPRLTRQVTVAVDNFRQFSRGCQGVSAQTSKTELDQWLRYKDAGADALEKAADLVKAAQAAGG